MPTGIQAGMRSGRPRKVKMTLANLKTTVQIGHGILGLLTSLTALAFVDKIYRDMNLNQRKDERDLLRLC